MLTQKQHDLLIYIHNSMKKNDIAPSFEEMMLALGLKSKSGIHRLIGALVERGYLERLPHRARALKIVKMPKEFEEASSITKFPADIPQKHMKETSGQLVQSLPLYGRIAAGTPIEAIRDDGQTIDIPPFMLGEGEHYALEIDGESMINAGINDGDIVIIKKTSTVENGTIAVALVDDHEATLKRIRRSGSKIILEPENDTHEPQVLSPDRVKIQGMLVSLMRQY